MAMPGIGGGRCLRACERIGASDLHLPSRDARLGTRVQVAREVINPSPRTTASAAPHSFCVVYCAEHGRKYDDEERDPLANGDWKHPWYPRIRWVGYGVHSTPTPPTSNAFGLRTNLEPIVFYKHRRSHWFLVPLCRAVAVAARQSRLHSSLILVVERAVVVCSVCFVWSVILVGLGQSPGAIIRSSTVGETVRFRKSAPAVQLTNQFTFVGI